MARLGFVDTEGNIFHINQNPDNSVLRKKKKEEEAPAMVKVAQTVEPTVKTTVDNTPNAEGYVKTNKKYGDYFNDDERKNNLDIYKKDGKSYYKGTDGKYNEIVHTTGQSLQPAPTQVKETEKEKTNATINFDNKKELKYQPKEKEEEKLSPINQIKLDTEDLTKEEKKKYKKSLLQQEEQEREKSNFVRRSGTGIDALTGAYGNVFENPNNPIQKEIAKPLENAERIYESGKLNNKLALEWYKKAQGKSNNVEEIEKEIQKFNNFNQDIASGNVGWLGESIQNANTQVESLKNQGIAATGGAILGGGLGALVGLKTGDVAGGALKGSKLGAKAGYAFGSTPYMYKLEYGNSYKDMKELGVSDKKAKNVATAVASINSAIESGENIVDLLSFSGAGKLASSEVKGQVANKMADDFKDIIEDLGEEKAKSYIEKKFGPEVAEQVFKTYTKNVTSESLEEGSQELTSILGERYATKSEGINRGISVKEDAERVGKSALAGGSSALAFGIPTSLVGNATSYVSGKTQNAINNMKQQKNINTQDSINTQQKVETKPTIEKNNQIKAQQLNQIEQDVKTGTITPEQGQVALQQVQTRVEPQTIETKPVENTIETPRLTQQIQENNKQKQFDIVNSTNPMQDEYHSGIRSKDDIKTWDEVMNLDDDTEGQFAWGDYSREDALKDKEKGTITIYSSKPIENGNFVSTSKIQAEEYAGGPGSKIYSKEVPLNEVAWINGDEGQYAKIENNNIPVETSKLTQQEQQELDTLKDIPFELDEQQERRMDELLLKQNKDLEKNMSPVRDLSDVRDFNEVGDRKINAYQYDNPEVKPYFQEVAKDMLYDLGNSTKGERYMTEDGQFKGIKRNVPNDIAELLDGENGVKYSYKEIEDGLNAIIKDNGAENKAVAKRLEFYIDQRLRNGYMDSIVGKIPANNEYIETLRNKNAGENPNIPAEKAKEPVIVAKNNNGQEIKLKQSKNNPGIYNQEAISRDIKDINNQYKNKVVKGKNGMEVSNFYSNITEKSKFIDTDIRNMFKNENDLQFYKTVSNEESLNKANKEIGNTIKSQEKAFDDFISKKEQFDSTDMAKGWILLERFNQAADYDRAYLVAKQMKEMGTKSGQAIQMLNLQSRLTPEGMYKWAVSELMEAENKFNSEKGRTKQEIEKYRDSFRLTAEETEFIKNQMEKIQDMPQGREKNIELAKINSMLQNKLPHQKGQSLKSWMRISMLFNPKTQVRNVMGNTIITPVNAVSDVFASGVDKLISKKTGKRTIGAPSLGGLAAYGKGALQGIKEATQDYRLGIDTKNINQDRFDVGQGKAFNENHSGPLKGLRNKAAKGLNATNDLLGYVMDVGDRAFYQGSVENSLYNQQKINNTKEITNEMREIAENEGLQRTWNDNNEYTKAVLDLRRSINKIGDQMHMHVGEYGLGDLLIPFAKTPANLTKAIVDYSPVGFVNAITEGKNLKNAIETGNYTPQMQHDFSQTIGKATAGTLLYALGTILAKANITTGNSDEDKDLKNFMRYNLGIQPYSIKIGDKSFTYDWAQPIAAPFAITADVQKGMQENMTPSQAVQHFLTTGFNILSEQSFLSGINEVFNDNDGILSGMEQQIINLPATAMPTLLKQITDMFDGTKRQTYSTEGQIENMKKVAKSKDPVGSKQLAPQVDVLGNEIEKYGGDNNAFNVFFNPANTEKGKKTPVAEEIYSLYEATQDKSIIPRKVDYSTKINGENKVLTTQEMEKWQKASGKLVTQEVKRAMNSDDYKEMNNDEKAKVINKIVNYSYQKAKSDTFDTPLANTYNGVEKARNKGIPIADYYISTVLKSSR